MGVESVGVEATPHVPGPGFPNLTDRISRPSGTFADGLESKGPKLWADVNRKGPYVFGSSMAPTPKASNSEGSNSEGIQHSSDKIRFGGIPSSLSSIGGGYASRTVSVSELFAHRNRAGKSTGKQKPTVTIDPGPITSAFSTFSLSTSGSTNPNDSTAASSVHLKPDSSVPTSADGRRFSAVSEDSRYPTPSLSTFGTGSNSKASSSLPQQFVFSAGTGARTDSFKPATPDSSFSGSFVTTTYFSVPSSTPSGPPELSTQSNVNVETTYAGLSKATKEANVPLEKVFPLGAATSVASASSEASVPFNGTFVTDQSVPADIASKLNQLDIDQGFNLPPKFTKLDLNKDAEKTVETTSFVVPNIEQKLKKLDIDQGASLSEKLSKLGVNKCQKDSLGTSSCVFGTQGANGIESDDSTGTSSGAPFVFGATATSSAHAATVPPTTGSQQPETVVPNFSSSFKFSADGETKQPASKVKKDKHRPLRPGLRPKSRTAGPSPQGSMETTTPSPNREAVSMDFSPQNSNATTSSSHSGLPDFHIPFVPDFDLNNPGVPDGETRLPASKLKKDKHRPLRQGLRSKGRSTTTSSRGNFEATTSREGRSAEFSPQDSNTTSTSSHSRFPDFSMPRVPNFDLNNPVVPPLSEQGGLNSRASAFELNLGTKSDVPKGSSSSFSSFRFEENDSLLGQKHDAEPSSSAGFGQTWKRAPSSDVQAAASSDYDSGWGEQADTINESTDVSDPPDARGRNDGSDRTDRESEAGRSSEDANCSGAGTTSRIELDGKPGCSPFMFSSSSPSGMSNSNLRRRARKVQREKSGVRVVQAEKPAAAVLEPDTSNARPFSSRSDNWSGLPGLGGLGYGDGVNTSMGVGTIAAEQVCERWRLRGNQAYAKGDFVKAEEFYSLGAGSVSPNETSESCIRASVLCYSNRAATRMVVGRMREALADCMHAMAVDPSFFRVHLRAASCYLVLGEIDLAATAFKECLTQAKESKKLDSKVLADASEGLKKAQQVVEYSAQVRKLLQNNSSGDAVTALRLLNEALLTSSQSEWLLELKAYALISLQRYSEAVQLCDQTLALAQQNHVTPEGVKSTAENTPLSWRRRITAKAYFHLGKLEESLEQLQQLQQLHEGPSSMFPPDPDSPGALSSELTVPSMTIIRDLLRHKLEGNKAFQAGKHAEALEHYSAALARNAESRPFCAVCLCNRAAASQALGHIADAIADCSRAIALDPRYAKAISRRAALHEKVRDYGQSCNDLRRLIALYERHLNSQRTGSLKSTSSQDSSTADELQQAKDRLMKSEEELKKGHPLDHYSILGLELGCSVNEIKKAYRKAALRHHPDKAGQFLVRSGDIGDDVGPWKDVTDENVRKDGEKLIDEVRKDSEQLFKLIGEAYAVLSDPSKRSRYDAEEELRKLRTRTNDLSKNVFNERKHSRTNDGTNGAQFKGAWSSSNVGGEAGNQSRANRQRERWDGFNYQYQRWHPGPDAAQPDIYARRGQPTGSNYGSSHRSNPWRWEEYPWDDV